MSFAHIRRGLSSCAPLICLLTASYTFGVGIYSLGPVDTDVTIGVDHTSVGPAVSGDGSTVAASSSGNAFTWTLNAGKNALPSGGQSAFTTALSYDGAMVVGSSQAADGYTYATMWTSAGQSLITHFLTANCKPKAISNDGSAIGGYYPNGSSSPFKSTSTSLWELTDLSTVYGMSADGKVITGSRSWTAYNDWGPIGFHHQARIWQSGTYTDLGSLSLGGDSFAMGISADGKTVCGWASSDSMSWEPFRWTAETGMVGLDAPDGWSGPDKMAWMNACTADGSILVGTAWNGAAWSTAPQQATIWDDSHGTRFLSDALVNDYSLDLTGWQLNEATGISQDGHTIVGYGIGPSGSTEGFAIVIPEPTGLCLLMAGFALTLRTRRTIR